MDYLGDLERDKAMEAKEIAFKSPIKTLKNLLADFSSVYEMLGSKHEDLTKNGLLIQSLSKEQVIEHYMNMIENQMGLFRLGNIWVNETIEELQNNEEDIHKLLLTANQVFFEKKHLQTGAGELFLEIVKVVEMQKETRKILEETRKILDEREELLKLREILISQVVHDLKHPIMVIMGYVDISDDVDMLELTKQFPEVEPELLEKIAKAVVRDTKGYLLNAKAASIKLKDMAGDIIDVSMIRIGEVQRKLEKDINFSELIFKLVDERSVIFTVSKINLNFNVSDNFPEKVETDQKKIERILLNLIANAEKFTPENGTISVCLDYNQEEDKIILTISDTGEGMTPETIEGLFEPFRPGEGNKKSETGLGLSTVKTFVGLLKGRIEVESELQKGSLFRVILPRSYDFEVAENPAEA
jgi:signal transduction histidine kinase